MNLENINLTMDLLKGQSETLKAQYNEILKTDNAIQRKIKFVGDQLEDIEIGKIETKVLPKRAYIYLGQEKKLYRNEAFYFFPTIAFYHYNLEFKEYERSFGAYIEHEITMDKEYKNNINYIEEQKFLCFYYKGVHKEIPNKIASIRTEYKDLTLSLDFTCINIVDQFLENNAENFITEIQIPILNEL